MIGLNDWAVSEKTEERITLQHKDGVRFYIYKKDYEGKSSIEVRAMIAKLINRAEEFRLIEVTSGLALKVLELSTETG
jgi:hypothetical protein